MKALQNLATLASIGKIIEGAGKTAYLLYDQFTTDLAAGAVNGTAAEPTGGIRTVTDTNTKISLSSGVLSFATGEAANDGVWYLVLSRVAGRMLLGSMNISASNGANLGWDTNASGGLADAFRLASSNTLQIVRVGSALTVGTFSNSTDYQVCVVLRGTGTYWFIKGGSEFASWTLAYFDAGSGNASMQPAINTSTTSAVFTADNVRVPATTWLPTPLVYDTFTRSNGALGSTEAVGPDSQGVEARAWTGSTWTVSSNAAINTPATLGSELITNGSFASNTTGWTASGATLASVAGGQSGNCLEVTNTGAANGYAYQSFTTEIGQWYYVDVYQKNGLASSSVSLGTSANGSQYWGGTEGSAGSFQHLERAFLATATTSFITLKVNSTVTSDTTLFDEVSIRKLTPSELMSSVSTVTSSVILDTNITIPSARNRYSSTGLVMNLDSVSNPQNFVLATIDRNGGCYLIKCVGGTYTTVISGSGVTYSAGATLRVIKDGTTYRLYYNNALVGSASTISDAGIINGTLHGLFSTYSGNTLDNFTIFPRGTADEYNQLNSF